MIETPKCFQKENFRFCLIRPHEKRPFELKWQKENNYPYDSEKLILHQKNGGNYGLCLGYGNLVCLDFDDDSLYEKMVTLLPETLTIQSGSGEGHHLYYYCNKTEAFKIENNRKEKVLEFLGQGNQAVAPSSIHPCGKSYKIEIEREIAQLSIKELDAILFSVLPEEAQKRTARLQKAVYVPSLIKDEPKEAIRSKITISSLLSNAGINISRNPTQCPLHPNPMGDRCLSFTNVVWHCFDCLKGGDVFHLYQELNNCDFVVAKQELAKLSGVDLSYYAQNVKYSNLTKEVTTMLTTTTQGKDNDKKKARMSASEKMVTTLKEMYHFYTIRHDKAPEMWIYHEGIYIPQGESFIHEFCRIILGEDYNTHFAKDIIDKIKADTFVDGKWFFSQANKNYEEVPVKNGILNFKTRDLQPFTHEKIFFNKLQVNYNPEATCPNFLTHLHNVLKHESDIEVVQELFGYTPIRNYTYEKMFLLVGDGRNGKGKTLDVLQEIIGAENYVTIKNDDMEKSNFSKGDLFGKLLNVCGDIDNTTLKKTGELKGMSGRTSITAQRKFLSSITFVNYAKTVWCANNLPRVYDDSLGFWDRWVWLEFPYTFKSQKDIEALSKEEQTTNIKLMNPRIIETMTTKEELEGVLVWSLDGYNRLVEQGDFSSSISVKNVKKNWQIKSDSFKFFLTECCKEEGEIAVSELKEAYLNFCIENKIKPKYSNISRTMEDKGVYQTRLRDNEDKLLRKWIGISLKDSFVTNVTNYPIYLGGIINNNNSSITEKMGNIVTFVTPSSIPSILVQNDNPFILVENLLLDKKEHLETVENLLKFVTEEVINKGCEEGKWFRHNADKIKLL